VGPENKKIKY